MNRKEYGSDFHYIDSPEWRNVNSSNSFFDDDNLSLYYSGRAALYSIIKNGIKYIVAHIIPAKTSDFLTSLFPGNEFLDNAMDILQDIDDYKKFCYENKLPFRYNHLYKPYTPWKIFYNWKKSGIR